MVRLFQSSPSPKTGRYLISKLLTIHQRLMFQSSPSPKTGRYASMAPRAKGRGSNPHPVRRLGAILVKWRSLFFCTSSNPHPVRRLGAIRGLHPTAFEFFEFQSSPSPKTGRYLDNVETRLTTLVPILTQSEDWALFAAALLTLGRSVVPILTQSEDWALYRRSPLLDYPDPVPILTQSEDWALSFS